MVRSQFVFPLVPISGSLGLSTFLSPFPRVCSDCGRAARVLVPNWLLSDPGSKLRKSERRVNAKWRSCFPQPAGESKFGFDSVRRELLGGDFKPVCSRIAAKDGERDLAFAEFKRAVVLDFSDWSALASFGLLEIEFVEADGLKRSELAIDDRQPSESLLLKRR